MLAPQLTKVRQIFVRESIAHIEETVYRQLGGSGLKRRPGAAIAIAAGSRGISNVARIVRATADFIRRSGAEPFVVPAMGSHGGATAEGQKEILGTFGITEQGVGCPIRSSMETVELPGEGLGHRLFMDRIAYESDGVILINRIKPHTDFHGSYESGLAKMAVVGLGKERQASEIHRFGVYGLRELVPRAAARVLATGKIVLGIAIVENAYEETSVIEAIDPQRIMEREPELLAGARQLMPGLPVDSLDVLIIDRMGKEISGAGMDPNVIGRIGIRGQEEPQTPDIKMVVVADLSEPSHGNATGVGLADVTTRRLLQKIDFAVTYTNVVTSSFLERGKLPVVAETDEEALAYALRGCGPITPGRERVIRIKDTLRLDELYVSQSVLDEIRGKGHIEVIGEPLPLFDGAGSLKGF